MRRDGVGPAHEFGEVAAELRLDHLHCADEHLALGAVDGDDIALLQRAGADADGAAFGVDLQGAGAADARTAHAARDDGGVARSCRRGR